MPDFPNYFQWVPRMAIGTVGYGSMLADWANCTNTVTTTAAVWPSANRAIFTAVYTDVPVLVQTMGIQVSTQSGNVDVGIYDAVGTRLVAAGTTSTGAAGLQTFNITDTRLNPGQYWIAMACDNTTAGFTRLAPATNVAQVTGVQQMASAMNLPATATFANPASAYAPVVTLQLSATL